MKIRERSHAENLQDLQDLTTSYYKFRISTLQLALIVPFTKSDDFDLLVHYYQTSSLGHLCGTKTKEQKAQIPFRKFMADSWKFVFKVESSRFNSSIPSA